MEASTFRCVILGGGRLIASKFLLDSQEWLTNDPHILMNLLILCANLDRRKDRKFVIERIYPSICGIAIQFLEAIDGSSIHGWKAKRKHADATQSGYAVRLTKCIALRRFLHSDHDTLLYFEDDIVLSDDFEERLLEGIERGYEILYLGGGHRQLPEGSGRWLKCRHTYNNHALLFSREGARKALKILRSWKMPWSDQEFQLAMTTGQIDAWCVQPWVAFQRKSISDNWGNGDCIDITKSGKPWMDGDDLAVLSAAATSSQLVIEYGSGGSTLHLGAMVAGRGKIISVEHNSEWYGRVLKDVEDSGFPITLVLREPVPKREADGPWRFLPRQLDAYVEFPKDYVNEEEADLVFIDGRERIRCALFCAPLLKPGGFLLIHDFFPRHRYRSKLPELLKSFEFLFDTPGRGGKNPQGMAVFRRRQ